MFSPIRQNSLQESEMLDFREVLNSLRYLQGVTAGASGSLVYSDQLYSCKRALILLGQRPAGGRGTKVMVACCNAALILLELYYRGVRINSRLLGTSISRLQNSLQVIPLNDELISGNTEMGRLLFWAIFVGGGVSIRRLEHTWFLSEMALIRFKRKINSWADTESILQSVLWHRSWSQPYCNLWGTISSSSE